MYEPENDGSAADAAAGYRVLADVFREQAPPPPSASPALLRPLRTEADARAAVIRSRLLRAVNAMLAAGAIDREIAGEFVAAIDGATA